MKMGQKTHCSIVIRAYNEEKHIGRLLTGILQQTVRDIEIILVDSGSTDATVAIASRYPVKVVHIKPEEFTFGRSLNLGIEHTSSEFIVMASAHVYPVYPDWLEQLLHPFTDPQVGMVYGKQRGNTTTKFSEHQLFAKMYPEQSDLKQRSPICNNANAAIRRSLWLQHRYDENLTGLEDLDWATWAISQNHFLAYAADAEVVHVHNETHGQVYNRYRREAMALKRIRPAEHFRLLDFLRLFVSNVVSDGWFAAREHLFLREFLGVIRFRFAQFWGTYKGFSISGPLTGQLKQTFYYPRRLRPARETPRREIQPINYPVKSDDSPIAGLVEMSPEEEGG